VKSEPNPLIDKSGKFSEGLGVDQLRNTAAKNCVDPTRDEFTDRFRAIADGWRDIATLDDREAAALIRHDAIDILVDLTGHMSGNRLPLFARRPAPVQVTYVGHPDTTGMRGMDYRLTDVHADPSDGDCDRFYTERLVRLPRTFGCYQRPEFDLPIESGPARSAGHVTFGCLNNPAKITPAAVALWCEVLRGVEGSRLVILNERGASHLPKLFTAHGFDASSGRVEFVEPLDRLGYFKAFDRVDIALDPFPYNGQTTTCDGLWMGVPTITLAGNAYVTRMGVSLLTNVGLVDLIAPTPQAYVEIATALARQFDRLGALRTTLRQRLLDSPVMDGPALARDVEQAYRQMWRAWCEETNDVVAGTADVGHVFHQ